MIHIMSMVCYARATVTYVCSIIIHARDTKKFFGEGIVVKPCAYEERKTGKEYQFWMTPDTLHCFKDLQILPNDEKRSKCEDCIAGRKHQQAACPQKGDKRPRESGMGQLQKAMKNRIPSLLASVIGRALIQGRERSEFLEQLETRRVR